MMSVGWSLELMKSEWNDTLRFGEDTSSIAEFSSCRSVSSTMTKASIQSTILSKPVFDVLCVA